jgi:hypothetical protein
MSTIWIQSNGQNYRGDHPDLNYGVPAEVDVELAPTLLALTGVVEVAGPASIPPPIPEPIPEPVPEPIPETPAAAPAPENPKE